MGTFLSLLFFILTVSNHSTTPSNTPVEPKTIYILEMGDVQKEKIKVVSESLKKFYKVNVKLLGRIPVISDAEVKGMNRYDASKLLSFAQKKYPNIKGKLFIITNEDISMDRTLDGVVYKNWRILGYAFINKNYCVVSTKRIKSNNRLTKVSVHEIGHTFGLQHCNTKKCVMNDAKGKGSTLDKVNLWMCDKCTNHIF